MRSNIEQQVMASVAVVYTARSLTSRFALKVYALVISFSGIVLFVSLPHVTENFTLVAHGGIAGVATFLLAAVLKTKLIVQLALLIGACAVISILFDAVRSVSPTRRLAI